MPEWSVQRRFPRYEIKLPMLYTRKGPTPARVGVGWTRELSEGGACVELNEGLQLQTPLTVRLQTDRGAIEGEAAVVWASNPAPARGGVRHGVAFTQIAPGDYQSLQDLLLSKGETRQAGLRLPLEVAVTCQPKGHAGPPIQGHTGNISQGGLLLSLPQVLPPDTALELTLHTPLGPVMAEGVVVWVESEARRTSGAPIRHGLRFTLLGWSTSLSLGLFLAEPA